MNLNEGVGAMPESVSTKYVAAPNDKDCVWLMNEEDFIKWLAKYGRELE